MDRYTALVVIAAVIAIVVMVYLLIRYGIIGSTTTTTTTTTPPTTTPPTTTPPTTTPSTSPTSQYDTVTIINPSSAPSVKLSYYGQNANQTTTLQPGQSVTLSILNDTTVSVDVLVLRYPVTVPFPVYCYSFQVTQSGTVTLNSQQLNQCYENAIL